MVECIILETGARLDIVGDFSYTKAVSDIGDISKVMTSYSWSLKFLKTPNNTQVFEGLGMVGVESYVPYKAVKVDVMVNGITIIRNGNLQITETNKDEYKGVIKDGIIDFYNAIGDKTLGDLDLSELDHDNTRDLIFDNWRNLNDYDFSYLLADFNGMLLDDVAGSTNFSNVALLPSANVKYLFDKIFDEFGWTYSGLENLENEYLSFPLNSDYDPNTGLVVGSALMNGFNWRLRKGYNYEPFIFDSSGYDSNYINISDNTFIIEQSGYFGLNIPNYDFNGRGIDFIISINNSINIDGFSLETYDVGYHNLGWLNEGDTVRVILRAGKNSSKTATYYFEFQGELELYRRDASLINFSTNFSIYKIKDFIKEVMMQNCVIAITDVVNKHIRFMGFHERLEGDIVDWSKFLVSKESEKYAIGSYAQNNYLKHKYFNEGMTYNDGNITIENENLKVDNDLFVGSTFTAGEVDTVVQLWDSISTLKNYGIPYYETFEVETKLQDGVPTYSYKTLTGRMFFSEKKVNNINGVYVNDTLYIGEIPIAKPITFKNRYVEKYQEIHYILNRARIITVELALPEIELLNIDFSKRFWFAQEGRYFLLDRLNYKANGISTADFVEINID